MENIATLILFHHLRGDVDLIVRVSFMGFFARTSMFISVIYFHRLSEPEKHITVIQLRHPI